MIDYEATLQKFFAEAIVWLEKMKKRAANKAAQKNIEHAIDEVRTVAADPKKYATMRALYAAGLGRSEVVSGFIPYGTDNNSVWHIYSDVMALLKDLYGKNEFSQEEAKKKLLNSLKSIKYKNSSSLLKDFTYPFIPQSYFAVKAQNQK